MNKYLFSTLCFLSAFVGSSLSAAEEISEPPPPARDQGFTQTLMMIAIALLFFYFILWRPEQKRRKVVEEQRSTLKKGDRVTAMGIIGTVVKIQDQTVVLRMVDGNKIEFLKAAITEVLPPISDVEIKEKITEE